MNPSQSPNTGTGAGTRYLLDARPAMRASTGVGNYVLGIAGGFARLQAEGRDGAASLALFTSSLRDDPGHDLRSVAQSPTIELLRRRLPVRVLNAAWHRLAWPPIETLAGPVAIAHSPHPLLLPARRAAQVVTVHDLYFLDHADHTVAEVRRDYGQRLWQSLAAADGVVCVSRATADDVIARAPTVPDRRGRTIESKLTVVHNGVELEAFARPESAARSDYVLTVGTIEPRKNPERILEAIAAIDADLRLVWAGAPSTPAAAAAFKSRCVQLGIDERVRVLGYVQQPELRTLYAEALALVFPSLHEGFGLPILEAMAAECPVVTGNTSAMPEVAGDAAILVDPLDTASIASGVQQALDCAHADSLRRRGLERARSFAWESAAAETVDVYEKALNRTVETES